MARKRGFFAEIQHQQRLAEVHAARVHASKQPLPQPSNEHALMPNGRRPAASRSSEAERKRLEREAQAAYVEARKAEVDEMNDRLGVVLDEIGNLLSATLGVDDFVDLDSLKLKCATRRTLTHLEVPN